MADDQDPERDPAVAAGQGEEPPEPETLAPGVAEHGDVVAAAAVAAAEKGSEAGRTEERYARPDADRLSEDMLARVAERGTGATAAAFFDLDKTIIARSSTLVMGRTFFKDGLISPSTVLKGLYAQAVYQLVGADHAKMEQMRRAALDLTQGWDADRVRTLVRETMEEVIAPLVYAEALEVIAEHRRAGRDIWIISSSGEEIVEPFAGYLGVRDFLATRSGHRRRRPLRRHARVLRLRGGQGDGDAAGRRGPRVRPVGVLRLLGLDHRPADAGGGGPPDRRRTRTASCAPPRSPWAGSAGTSPPRSGCATVCPVSNSDATRCWSGSALAAAVGAVAWRVLGGGDDTDGSNAA